MPFPTVQHSNIKETYGDLAIVPEFAVRFLCFCAFLCREGQAPFLFPALHAVENFVDGEVGVCMHLLLLAEEQEICPVRALFPIRQTVAVGVARADEVHKVVAEKVGKLPVALVGSDNSGRG